ncbi:MAG: HEPN domain-containing protein [bacterium]
MKLGFYRSVVDNSQLAVENSIKALISFFRPIPKIHKFEEVIDELIKEARLEAEDVKKIERLKEIGSILGFEEHIKTDYGDELEKITPWELFDKEDADESLKAAKEAFAISKLLIEKMKKNK